MHPALAAFRVALPQPRAVAALRSRRVAPPRAREGPTQPRPLRSSAFVDES